jgi:virginiamycin A acetyltransferase
MSSRRIRRGVKRSLDLCCLAIVAPCALMCALEARLTAHGEAMFLFWAQLLALVPGLPGVFARRAFYRLTLDDCGRSFFVGFGAMFSHRRVVVEEDVYIGPYAIVGSSKLRRGCLLGSRASIVSGTDLHTLDADGRWTATDMTRLRQIEIGEYAWIGEASIVMADLGRAVHVAAGSVVANRVPAGVLVAGNPARFVKRVANVAGQENEAVTTTTPFLR